MASLPEGIQVQLQAPLPPPPVTSEGLAVSGELVSIPDPRDKPGIRSTEFWLPIILALVAMVADRLGMQWLSLMIGGGSAASAGTYPISAGMRKARK